MLFRYRIAIFFAAILAAIVFVTVNSIWDGNADSVQIKTEENSLGKNIETNYYPRGRGQKVPGIRDDYDGRESVIAGRLLDENGRPIVDGDIIYKIVAVSESMECDKLTDLSFELDVKTNIENSDDSGKFNLFYYKNDGHCLVINAAKDGYEATIVSIDIESIGYMLEIELLSHRRIEGKVKGPDRALVDGALLTLWQANDNFSIGREEKPCDSIKKKSTTNRLSDDKGQFSFDAVAGQIYCVQARHSQLATSEVVLIEDNVDRIEIELGERGFLSGIVKNLDDLPVKGLTLQLIEVGGNSGISYISMTDDNGGFTFTDLDAVNYELRANDLEFDIARPTSVSLKERSIIEHLEVIVYPSTTIVGRIVNDIGDSVPGVRVSVRSPFVADVTLTQTISDENGNFSIRSKHQSKDVVDTLKMAKNYLLLEHPEFNVDAPVSAICLDFYHEKLGGKHLSVSSDNARLNIGTIILDAPIIPVSGVVKNHVGETIAASVTIIKTVDAQAVTTRCDQSITPIVLSTSSDGKFDFHVEDGGEFSIKIETEKYQPRYFVKDLEVGANYLELLLN